MLIYRLNQPLKLESGKTLSPVDIAYSISGTPHSDGSNVIVICHTLTGGIQPKSSSIWWFVGPGKLIDTDYFCVIAMAALGSWHGGSSPCWRGNNMEKPLGIDFPTVSVIDSVRAHHQLLTQLGICHARAVIGGSFGGFFSYAWLAMYPEMFDLALIFQSALLCSAHTMAFFSLAKELICSDPAWNMGKYNKEAISNMVGIRQLLGLNRLIQLSHARFEELFPTANRQKEENIGSHFSLRNSKIDEFMLSAPKSLQGLDPNSFLCLMQSSAMFDLEKSVPNLWERWKQLKTHLVQIPCAQDWRYPVSGMLDIHRKAKQTGVSSHFHVTRSRYGHGSFLHDPESLKSILPLLYKLLYNPQ